MKRIVFVVAAVSLHESVDALKIKHHVGHDELSQIDGEVDTAAPTAPAKKKAGGMTQFLKAYALKYTDLVSTTRMAAERMAPVLRGYKAAEELAIMKANHGKTVAACNKSKEDNEKLAKGLDPKTGKPLAPGTPAPTQCDYYPNGGPKWTPDGQLSWPAPPAPCVCASSYFPKSVAGYGSGLGGLGAAVSGALGGGCGGCGGGLGGGCGGGSGIPFPKVAIRNCDPENFEAHIAM